MLDAERAVAQAVWQQRRIRIRYHRWAAPTEVTRVLEPLGLVLKAGRWYLIARVVDGNIRTYRVSAILKLRRLDEPFDRPDGFRLVNYWQAYLTGFDANWFRDEAVVRLSPAGRDLVRHLMEPAVSRAAEASAGPPDAHGWVRVVLPMEGVGHATANSSGWAPRPRFSSRPLSAIGSPVPPKQWLLFTAYHEHVSGYRPLHGPYRGARQRTAALAPIKISAPASLCPEPASRRVVVDGLLGYRPELGGRERDSVPVRARPAGRRRSIQRTVG